jgi:predicted helicase
MESNKEKGDNYELQIKKYIINDDNIQAYLWYETPETILIDHGIIGSHNQHRLTRINNKENPLIDTRVDIIQLDNDKCSLVQCKNGYKKEITMNDLAGFMCWTSLLDQLDAYIYYTTKLSTNIRELPVNKRINYIKQPYIINEVVDKNIKIIPYDYQLEAVKLFEDFNRGILSMPCGTGKTLESYLISIDYHQIIIISPLKLFSRHYSRFNS